MFMKKTDGPGAVEPPKPIYSGLSLNPLRAATAQSLPAPQTRSGPPPVSGGPSVIGSDLVIIGNLQSRGEVTIEGQVQGDLQAQRIVIGQGARITGGIVADDVVVQGTVQGSIRGNRVTLQSNSKVEGDVFHQSLAIEQGAYFEGKSRRSENPLDTGTRSGGVEVGQALQNGSLN